MKAMLTFTLPDEQAEYDCASKGAQYKDALVALADDFRAHRKYGAGPVTESLFYAVLEACDVTIE